MPLSETQVDISGSPRIVSPKTPIRVVVGIREVLMRVGHCYDESAHVAADRTDEGGNARSSTRNVWKYYRLNATLVLIIPRKAGYRIFARARSASEISRRHPRDAPHTMKPNKHLPAAIKLQAAYACDSHPRRAFRILSSRVASLRYSIKNASPGRLTLSAAVGRRRRGKRNEGRERGGRKVDR